MEEQRQICHDVTKIIYNRMNKVIDKTLPKEQFESKTVYDIKEYINGITDVTQKKLDIITSSLENFKSDKNTSGVCEIKNQLDEYIKIFFDEIVSSIKSEINDIDFIDLCSVNTALRKEIVGLQRELDEKSKIIRNLKRKNLDLEDVKNQSIELSDKEYELVEREKELIKKGSETDVNNMSEVIVKKLDNIETMINNRPYKPKNPKKLKNPKKPKKQQKTLSSLLA